MAIKARSCFIIIIIIWKANKINFELESSIWFQKENKNLKRFPRDLRWTFLMQTQAKVTIFKSRKQKQTHRMDETQKFESSSGSSSAIKQKGKKRHGHTFPFKQT